MYLTDNQNLRASVTRESQRPKINSSQLSDSRSNAMTSKVLSPKNSKKTPDDTTATINLTSNTKQLRIQTPDDKTTSQNQTKLDPKEAYEAKRRAYNNTVQENKKKSLREYELRLKRQNIIKEKLLVEILLSYKGAVVDKKQEEI